MTRSALIEAGELAFLVARRRLASARPSPDAVAAARKSLHEAAAYFMAAGLSHRADTVARYAYRIRPRCEQTSVTLTDALLQWRFGPQPEQTEGGEA